MPMERDFTPGPSSRSSVDRLAARIISEADEGFTRRDKAMAEFIAGVTGEGANVAYCVEWRLYPALIAEKRALAVRGLADQLAEAEDFEAGFAAWLNRKAGDMTYFVSESGSTSASTRLAQTAAGEALAGLMREVAQVLS